jgi:hypothetical protein
MRKWCKTSEHDTKEAQPIAYRIETKEHLQRLRKCESLIDRGAKDVRNFQLKRHPESNEQEATSSQSSR